MTQKVHAGGWHQAPSMPEAASALDMWEYVQEILTFDTFGERGCSRRKSLGNKVEPLTAISRPWNLSPDAFWSECATHPPAVLFCSGKQ